MALRSAGCSSASTGGGFSGSGGCNRTATHFSQFNFTADTGGTLYHSTLYGLHTGDWLVIPPVLNTETMPVYTVNAACPQASASLNWIFVQWDTGTRTMQNTYVLGTANYSLAGGVVVTGQYDVTGAAYYLGSTAMPGSCSNGVYTISGQSSQELDGSIYFSSNAAGVFKTTPGHATFFFSQYSVNASADLASTTFQGIAFDSFSATDSSNIKVSSNSTGSIFTVQLYSDPGAGTINGAYTDTITITSTNSPQKGMMIGTVTRLTGGTGAIACIVNKSLDMRVICTGQSPANNPYPYTVAFVAERLNVLGQRTTMSQEQLALGMNAPAGAFSDGTRLFVSDSSNNRVLIWNTVPTSGQTPADVVVGQTNLMNNGAGTTSETLSGPAFPYSDGTKLYVADSSNNRVLIWNAIPTVKNVPADVVLGQPDMTSNSSNTDNRSMNTPTSVYSDGTRLYVADYKNGRVLIWNTNSPATHAAASHVVDNTLSSLNAPVYAYSDGTKLYVAVHRAGHVLVWNTIPTADQAETRSDCWSCGSSAPSCLSAPTSIYRSKVPSSMLMMTLTGRF